METVPTSDLAVLQVLFRAPQTVMFHAGPLLVLELTRK